MLSKFILLYFLTIIAVFKVFCSDTQNEIPSANIPETKWRSKLSNQVEFCANTFSNLALNHLKSTKLIQNNPPSKFLNQEKQASFDSNKNAPSYIGNQDSIEQKSLSRIESNKLLSLRNQDTENRADELLKNQFQAIKRVKLHGVVVFVTADGVVHGLNRTTGEVLWTQKDYFGSNSNRNKNYSKGSKQNSKNVWHNYMVYSRNGRANFPNSQFNKSDPEPEKDVNKIHGVNIKNLKDQTSDGEEFDYYEDEEEEWLIEQGVDWSTEPKKLEKLKTEWKEKVKKRRFSKGFFDTSYSENNFETWFLAEPSSKGGLYVFNQEKKLIKLPLSIPDLVGLSPVKSHNNIYFGSKTTRYISLDALTGNITSILDDDEFTEFDEYSNNDSCKLDPQNSFEFGESAYRLKVLSEPNSGEKSNPNIKINFNKMKQEWTLGYREFESTKSPDIMDIGMIMAETFDGSCVDSITDVDFTTCETKIVITTDGHVSLVKASTGAPIWISFLESVVVDAFDLFKVSKEDENNNSNPLNADSENSGYKNNISNKWDLMIQKRLLSPSDQQKRYYLQKKMLSVLIRKGYIKANKKSSGRHRSRVNNENSHNYNEDFNDFYDTKDYINNETDDQESKDGNDESFFKSGINSDPAQTSALNWLKHGLWTSNIQTDNEDNDSEFNSLNRKQDYIPNKFHSEKDHTYSEHNQFTNSDYGTIPLAHVGKLQESLFVLSKDNFAIVSKSVLNNALRASSKNLENSKNLSKLKTSHDSSENSDHHLAAKIQGTENKNLALISYAGYPDDDSDICRCDRNADYPMCLIGLHQYSSFGTSLVPKSPLEKEANRYFVNDEHNLEIVEIIKKKKEVMDSILQHNVQEFLNQHTTEEKDIFKIDSPTLIPNRDGNRINKSNSSMSQSSREKSRNSANRLKTNKDVEAFFTLMKKLDRFMKKPLYKKIIILGSNIIYTIGNIVYISFIISLNIVCLRVSIFSGLIDIETSDEILKEKRSFLLEESSQNGDNDMKECIPGNFDFKDESWRPIMLLDLIEDELAKKSLDKLKKSVVLTNNIGNNIVPVDIDGSLEIGNPPVSADQVQLFDKDNNAKLEQSSAEKGAEISSENINPTEASITSSNNQQDPLSIDKGLRVSMSSLKISQKIVGYGSHGTIIYLGSFEGRPVAVKRLLLDFYSSAKLEVEILKEADTHPNVIRYYVSEMSNNFLFIVLELCAGSLSDAITWMNSINDPGFYIDKNKKICYDLLSKMSPKRILYQLALGLHHLHQMKLVHRDIKPQNILITLPTSQISNSRGKSLKNKQINPSDDDESTNNSNDTNKDLSDSSDDIQNPFDNINLELIAGEPRVVISDFGLSRILQEEESSFFNTIAFSAPNGINMNPVVHGAGGTIGWRAPECLDSFGGSTKKHYQNKQGYQPSQTSGILKPENSLSGTQSSGSCFQNTDYSDGRNSITNDKSPYINRGIMESTKDNGFGSSLKNNESKNSNFLENSHGFLEPGENSDIISERSNSISTSLIDNMYGGRKMTRKMDIFSLGCVYFYILTNGHHPFGDRFSREQRILENRYDLFILEDMGYTSYPVEDSGNYSGNKKNYWPMTAVESSVEARDLIEHMIQNDPKIRPSTSSILVHPYFWSPSKRLLFFQDVSDKLESLAKLFKTLTGNPISESSNSTNAQGDKNSGGKKNTKKVPAKSQGSGKPKNAKSNSAKATKGDKVNNMESYTEILSEQDSYKVKEADEILSEFEKHSEYVINHTGSDFVTARSRSGPPGWDKVLCQELRSDLFKFRKYNFYKIRDLLRVIRNKKHHYQDLETNLRESLGDVPNGYCEYFESRFPNLLLHCYYFILENENLRTDPLFRQYFKITN
ncbi:hypothetical protein BB558_006741 [Smittium angustum]|uniref:non-specific serine/threonine protein kinase n=1 Tax=Smittium angustum TaxID=133377 RepID=A0A2U1IX44_SMIAN|nr:hypothetical protein BB558_006741 [Smittium angustum]